MTRTDDLPPSWVSRLKQVKWAKLDYAYGEATDVSALIQTIAFGEEGEACDAYVALHNELVHQASVYSSTYEAIPFLIEALAIDGNRSGVRCRVLYLLDDIADSCLHWGQIQNGSAFSSAGDRARQALPDEWKQWIERVWFGLDVFCCLLNDDSDADVRTYAARLLGTLLTSGPRSTPVGSPDRYALAVSALTARLQSDESDQLALSSVVFALGRASVHDPALFAVVRKASAKPNAGAPTRVAAALAVMEIDNGRHANRQETELLIDTMCRASETDVLYQVQRSTGRMAYSPWVTSKLRFRLCSALCAWSVGRDDRMEQVLPALLTGVRLSSAYSGDLDLAPVFRWLWPDRSQEASATVWPVKPPVITSKDLSAVARRVIQTCYENASIWALPIGNTSAAFLDVGLPDTRFGLKNLLDGAT